MIPKGNKIQKLEDALVEQMLTGAVSVLQQNEGGIGKSIPNPARVGGLP